VPRQNALRHNIHGQNIRRDETSGGTKHPERQNIWGDKTSERLNIHVDTMSGEKISVEQNIPGDKISGGTKRPGTNPHGLCFTVYSRYSYLSFNEKK
jgi:hypothetical protein